MTEYPNISVVIPTYNRARIVTKAIESVLAQTHPASEIIVVDDGSKDDTLEVLARYEGEIRIVSRPNTGISVARNDGIQAARCEWIAFLDDDDEYTPQRLEIAAAAIARHPEAVVHASNIEIVSEDGPPMDLFEIRRRKAGETMLLDRPLEWALAGCFFVQATVCRRAALIASGGFKDGFHEDLDLLVRMVSGSPWTVDGRRSLRLIRRPGEDFNLSNLARSNPVGNYESLARIHREALELPALGEGERRFAESGLATNLFELGRALHDRGESARARECFAEAAEKYPRFHSRAKARLAATFGMSALRLFGMMRRRREVLRSTSKTA